MRRIGSPISHFLLSSSILFPTSIYFWSLELVCFSCPVSAIELKLITLEPDESYFFCKCWIFYYSKCLNKFDVMIWLKYLLFPQLFNPQIEPGLTFLRDNDSDVSESLLSNHLRNLPWVPIFRTLCGFWTNRLVFVALLKLYLLTYFFCS